MLSNHHEIETDIEWLERDTPWHRFANNPVLQHLEKHWADGKAYVDISSGCQTFDKAVRLVMCPNPEAEVLVAAREIRRFVRGGGRFREIAVMARDLAPYSEVVRRVFASYDIPFFLDRREPVGHHPLAELTRSALKILAFDWQPEDWFAALKTGLMHEHEEDIDRLENEALARGWKAKDWRSQFQVSEDPPLEKWLEPLRKKLVAPFEALAL